MKITLIAALAALFSAPLQAQPAAPTAASMSDVFMSQLDADKDGKVSKEEFLTPHQAQFSAMDKDGDGNLNRDEVNAFAQKMQQRMQQMRSQGGQPPSAPAKP